MKIILSAQTPDINSPIERRFGRCPYLLEVDTETDEWQALSNPGVGQSGGAGVAAAQLVVDQKGEAVISGDFGPNAANALKAASLPMYLYNLECTTVQQAVEQFKLGQLELFK
ncbi:MAG: NifB/NifX family molybdenum-iron cluster-binding protein [Anaerolineaceae bacterium]|nr:NifB/NifX family molybdenum-iron cluster-binding protein [Anaerolineaceae bacterium]MBN2677576.1 NifB/NifX family molybdenum-iron cluster-binding protein [Anaerolineaceae bacterium]